MAHIEISQLFKSYKKTVAVNRIDLSVEKGELLTLLGPSGCGKTTTLRCIAGLEKPQEGEIVIDGRPMLGRGFVPPSRRGIGMVFQNYAVWPHMKVFNNVAYGLKLEKLPRQEIRTRTMQVLEMVGLGGLQERYPGQLSGGQQQRVALARAMVRNPKVLLLDEPLSNLDAKLREKMRFEIKSLARRMGITSVYVTHDQAEAMVISDRIAVMQAGNVVQIDTPQKIYAQPADRFVADFIGAMNFIAAKILQSSGPDGAMKVRTSFCDGLLCQRPAQKMDGGSNVFASIRPEDVEVFAEPPAGRPNLFRGTIAHRAYLGNFLYFFVDINGEMIRVQVPYYLPQAEGEAVYLYLDPQRCKLLV
ncbi:MAG: ABC transporter ATP-binding protein [Desulfobacteraceae bacterium]|nr:MAG: ABC transporter ATP-binding protein [Desulfobacteraceae bacterium]